ncbi:MAG TPA: phosphoglucosamine mutase, partial [Planctomycetota bacterium]|nr:phosphoglucosamine mutase [Planctomycetota bacterium]
ELAAGLSAEGAAVESAGVIPTPGVSYLVRRHGYDLGIVISASHNPPEYNGVKLFERDGTKSSDELEAAVERAYGELRGAPGDEPPAESGTESAAMRRVGKLQDDYVAALVELSHGRGRGSKVVLDCANGATGAAARAVFEALGADAILLNAGADGARINDGSGALHPELAAAAVREHGAAAGFSFDGDGDRVIAIDEKGQTHDGDDILCALGLFLKERGELPGDGIVATVLSNMGLEVRLGQAGVKLHRVPVGDRHVSRKLIEEGLALGGEQSGHIVLARAVGPTGDGIACAVELIRAAGGLGKPLSELLTGFARYPQVAKNVRVSRKPALETLPAVNAAIAAANVELARRGRILVRYSGTEPLARVMVEAEDPVLTERVAAEVAAVIAREIGAAA